MESMQIHMSQQTHQGPYLPPLQSQQQPQVYLNANQSSAPVHIQPYILTNTSTTAIAQTNNNNSPSPTKEKRSRRWSLGGRFFEKRKSVTQPFNNIPGSSTSYNNTNHHQQQTPPRINTAYNNNGKAPYSDDQQQQRISPVRSGGSSGSGGSNGSGHSDGSGNRRSSLADIPKAILSSFRRGSHSSPSETVNKEPTSNNSGVPASVRQQQQADDFDSHTTDDDDDNDSTAAPGAEDDQEDVTIVQQKQQENDFQPATATILTANGLMQATMAVPKSPPSASISNASSVKSILKKRSSSSPSPPPSAQQHQNTPLSRVQQQPSSNQSNSFVRKAGDDGQMNGSLRANDHRARLETSSPVPSLPHFHHHGRQQQQQQQQQQSMLSPGWTPAPGGTQPLQYPTTPAHYTGYGTYGEKSVATPSTTAAFTLPTKSTIEFMEDRQMPYGGAAFPPDFTPGIQSNVYQDRGGERSQGQVLDYRIMEMDPSFSFQGASTIPDLAVAAAASSNGYGYQYRGSSFAPQAYSQSYYGYDGQASFLMDDQRLMSTTMLQERDGYGPSSYSYSGSYFPSPMRNLSYGTNYSSNRNSHGILLTGNGIPHRFKTIAFTDTIEIIPAHRKSEYNRRSDKYATFKNLTPDLKSEIREELNSYKMREMAVHVESMGNTAFH
ncbi:hypothetical protein EC991_001239 [Linnemannia zychae]|nr:hypothetical protein EC991_001239 [Linnemannia zychae]